MFRVLPVVTTGTRLFDDNSLYPYFHHQHDVDTKGLSVNFLQFWFLHPTVLGLTTWSDIPDLQLQGLLLPVDSVVEAMALEKLDIESVKVL